MSDIFKLPASSYEEIIKVIQAYANEKEGVLLSLDDISSSTGVPRTVVSANNGFLVQIGIVTKGNKKSATEQGRSLGRAYISKIDDEIERLWKEIISENDFMNRMISAVRIRNGMDKSSFLNHIVYSSGQKDNKQNRAGAGALIEVFKNVGLIEDNDGKLTIIESEHSHTESSEEAKITQAVSVLKKPQKIRNEISIGSNCGVVINVNINCSPDNIDTLGIKIKNLIQELSEQ